MIRPLKTRSDCVWTRDPFESNPRCLLTRHSKGYSTPFCTPQTRAGDPRRAGHPRWTSKARDRSQAEACALPPMIGAMYLSSRIACIGLVSLEQRSLSVKQDVAVQLADSNSTANNLLYPLAVFQRCTASRFRLIPIPPLAFAFSFESRAPILGITLPSHRDDVIAQHTLREPDLAITEIV
jgi:hypothetical protein